MSKFQLLYHPSFTSEFNEQSRKREIHANKESHQLVESWPRMSTKININNKLCTPSSCA